MSRVEVRQQSTLAFLSCYCFLQSSSKLALLSVLSSIVYELGIAFFQKEQFRHRDREIIRILMAGYESQNRAVGAEMHFNALLKRLSFFASHHSSRFPSESQTASVICQRSLQFVGSVTSAAL